MNPSERAAFRQKVILNHLNPKNDEVGLEDDDLITKVYQSNTKATVSLENAVKYDVNSQGVAIITIDNPPVNSLHPTVLRGLREAIRRANNDSQVKAIVITGANNKFVGGFDISFIQKAQEANDEGFRELCELTKNSVNMVSELENGVKPSVAAIDGFALGGGLELSMACSARVATPKASLGLPELKLGIIPGFAGTQRLPRLVGVNKAVQMMLTSAPIKGQEAHQVGLVDSCVSSQQLINSACSLALDIANGRYTRRYTLKETENLIPIDQSLNALNTARKKFDRNPAMPQNKACLDAVEACIQNLNSPEGGLEAEYNLFINLIKTPSAKASVHVFFAMRQTTKVPGVTDNKNIQTRKMKHVGVLGGGTMGSGIATAALLAGMKVTLKEINQKLVDMGIKRIQSNISSKVKKGRMSQKQMDDCMSRLHGQTDYSNFDQVDIVIEAVLEKLELKQKVFADLERYCRPDCILATNTSSINIELIGKNTHASDRIVGLHFFSPAHIMQLLEIVRSKFTSDQVLADSITFAKQIRKTPVVVGNCPGFVVNRIFYPYGEAAHFLLDHGASPYDIDRALTKFGMPMGVFKMGDLAGVDVLNYVYGILGKAFPDRSYPPRVTEKLVEMKRLGQKSGAGWYKYQGRQAMEDPQVMKVIDDVRRETGNINKLESFSTNDIMETIIFSVINEACRVLDENMIIRASDIDVAGILGMGFPSYRGGVMKWAELVGPRRVYDKLQSMYEKYNEPLFAPSAYLKKWALSSPSSDASQTKNDDDIVIVSAHRTAVGKAMRGSFKDTAPDDLLYPVIKKVLDETGVSPSSIGDIVCGAVLPKGDEISVHVRVAAMLAGCPETVPVKIVNRLCSSGLQSIADVASAIRAGYYEIGIAAGVESMSQYRFKWDVPINPKAKDQTIKGCYLSMGMTSENVSERFNITRERQDEFAAESQRRAYEASNRGLFQEEIVPVRTTVKNPKTKEQHTVTVDKDEGIRKTTPAALAKLRPAFKKNGCSTAGNSSQLSDGAAAVLVMTRRKANELGLSIMGVLKSFAAVGVEPSIMGVGPAYAIPKALEMAQVSRGDIDIYEINEAFASQAYYCINKLQLDSSQVNPTGGAIALGHPLGCTGTRMTVTLLHALKRENKKRGVVSMCIGTGMGAAAVFERDD